VTIIENNDTRIGSLRALEALRNGVPNRDAVSALGSMQPKALDAFKAQLEALSASGTPAQISGCMLAGDFGVGKSHTLLQFEQLALEEGFAVSRVVVSKETPLHDPNKVFLAAVRNGRIPNSRGQMVQELAGRLDYRTPEAEAFEDWALLSQPHGLVAATVDLHRRLNDVAMTEELVDFWSGEKIAVQTLRQRLKDVGIPKAYDVKPVKVADLAPIRFELVSRLVRAARLNGWIILFDEVELVARYSLAQRTKSYAAIAQWMGSIPHQSIPGIAAVLTITDDYAVEVIDDRDMVKVPEKLMAKGDEKSLLLATLAESGMNSIRKDVIRLVPPNDDTLARSSKRLQDLYETAYGYTPELEPDALGGQHRDMRVYVRRWINNWDLQRIYGDVTLSTEEEEVATDYAEDKDLQTEAPDESTDG
jgi:hypothetical protein